MITVERRDGVDVIRIEHGSVNLLDLESLRCLIDAFESLVAADAIVLAGAGRTFSAGVDLRKILDGGAEFVSGFLPLLTRAFRTVFDHPRPVVAAVNGHAIAGGCIIAAACDYRLMSAGTIGVTELLVGVPFPATALEILRFAIGPETARMVLTGQTLPPRDALAIGLVDEVVEAETLMDRAVDRARQFAHIPTETYTLTKRQLRHATRELIDTDERADAGKVLRAWTSTTAREAIARYLDQLNARRSRTT